MGTYIHTDLAGIQFSSPLASLLSPLSLSLLIAKRNAAVMPSRILCLAFIKRLISSLCLCLAPAAAADPEPHLIMGLLPLDRVVS